MSKGKEALRKPYITNCIVCNKYISDELQSSVRKYCSTLCWRKQKYKKKKIRLRNNNRPVLVTDPKITRRKMQEEINVLCGDKK